jgi:hypothetical protein
MAGNIAEPGAAEEAAESLSVPPEAVALINHGNAKASSRDAPMRPRCCREGDWSSKVLPIWRFHLGGFGRAEQYYVGHEQAPTAGP